MFFWTNETMRRVLRVISPACVSHRARIEKKGNTDETEIEFIRITRGQFPLFYDGNGNRMVNINDHLKSIAKRVKHMFNFSDYLYQYNCFEFNKPVFNFCVCQTTVEEQNKLDVIFKKIVFLFTFTWYTMVPNPHCFDAFTSIYKSRLGS